MPAGYRSTELLLVEDDPKAASLFQDRLKHFAPGEFNITQARTLQSGLDEALDFEFALAVLDLTLPDSVGVDTCRRFAAAQPNVPFIVLTGVDDSATRETLARAGASAFFNKTDCTANDLVNAARGAATSPRNGLPIATSAVTEARFRNAIIDSADGIVVLDQAGNIVLVSAGAELLLGRTTADLSGATFGIELDPGRPVRAQMIRANRRDGTPEFAENVPDFLRTADSHETTVEFWPFAHYWANKPVTVCAIREIAGQVEGEWRQRDGINLKESLHVTAGVSDICTEIAQWLQSLVRYDRFEASVWRPDLQRLQIVAQFGTTAHGRGEASFTTPQSDPEGFGSWTSESSPENDDRRITLSIGRVDSDIFSTRDRAVLARCASIISAALRQVKTNPVLARPAIDQQLEFRRQNTIGSLDSTLPGAA